ncbi:uncharacterized protein PV09_01528 [Verruconis gallopava]|uniref:CAP-Gly domain-containing protein n=1 Tax=Verruconis gallopava TaxID=253628 RepID=A0A0D2ALD9_9PEZI|nr:uncharacterized protein PV09_01528 [Verruconis gallopava]KIW07573.1 hypothetical protein PV09_01528 [Verruconis gallopava]
MNAAGSNLQTPRRLGAPRPSLVGGINTASSPNLSAAAAVARKASLQALTGGSASAKMGGGDGHDIQIGDTVDVPGGMHGTAKFIGPIAGKNGVFLGVELAKQYAHKGKNDGDVDGVRYFATSVPNSGIFLPLHRATKRESIYDEFPPTPTTPSYSSFDLASPNGMPKFSQSVGPGARPPSPSFKPKQGRPSLPRPESPLRKVPTLAPTPGKLPSLSKSQIGTPRPAASPAPGRSVPKSRTPGPYSRNNSRLGVRGDESTETTPTPAVPPTRSSDGSAAGSGASVNSTFTPLTRRSTDNAEDEIKRLKKQLQERDKQLKEQAASLAEMEASLAELENLKGLDDLGGHARNNSGASGLKDADAAQLRAIIREKNERIAMLTAEFDAHRADFRSTIDTLEMASTETERVYEKKVEELLAEIRELQANQEEVSSMTQQIKQVEEIVAELEEGVEDARRSEAEARAEVEFLRGEIERTRAELKQEREKAAEALKSAEAAVGLGSQDSRDKEQMQDEIRGLRAIIHSLSSGGGSPAVERPALNRSVSEGMSLEEQTMMKATIERLEREKKELQGLIERKNFHEEELEREVERLKGIEQRASVISNGLSDRTAVQDKRSSARDSKGTVVNWRGSSGRIEAMAPHAEADTQSVSTGSGILWCEICETSGHDILTCTSIDKVSTNGGNEHDMDALSRHMQKASISSLDPDKPKPLATSLHKKPSIGNLPAASSTPPTAPLPNPYKLGDSVAAGKDGTKDPSKWCALCERDGHDSINCSFEDQFG